MKMTSRIALVAAAGFLIGATTQAKAADLGGGCCADLEERVAELEATTARKGNRVVSLQVYGQVSRALLIWDDGIDSDIYNVDNDLSSTRLGFQGSGTLRPDVTAGFKIEFNVQEADVSVVDQVSSDANDSGKDVAFDIRYAYAYVESATLGRITLGQQSESTDGITEINLGGSGSAVDGNIGAGFFVRDVFESNDTNNVRWGTLLDTSDGDRVNAIRYDSPSVYGFILSASFAEDDRYDVALRFSKEWNSIRLAAGIGYRLEDSDFKSLDSPVTTSIDENETVAGSISVMHVPTGLYAMFSASDQTTEFVGNIDDAEQSHWYVQGGITKNWLGYGNTTFYAAYGETEFEGDGDGGGAGPINIDGLTILGADTTQWGLGAVQAFDSTATEVFVHYVHYETDAFGQVGGAGDVFDADTEDFDAVLAGMTIKF
jgi:predicted porin